MLGTQLQQVTDKVEVNASAADPQLDARIMIVDDDPISVKIVQRFLARSGYSDFVTTSNPREARSLIMQARPDVLLLDVLMPEINGLDLLAVIRQEEKNPSQRLPVIVLTAAHDAETKVRSLELGASDFLGKPVDPSELIARVRNVLTVKAYNNQLDQYAQNLERQVRERTAELAMSRQELILSLARAAEFRDDDTGRHVVRVGRYVRSIAEEMGMDEREASMYEQAAQMHDVGKIGIPDNILLKPGKLEPHEFERMQKHCNYGKQVFEVMGPKELEVIRRHTHFGGEILKISRSPILKLAHEIALSHHEHWNGNGYPLGLKGEDIPLGGRITAVADVFDALSTKRPYKPAFPREKCFEIMRAESGEQFDPEILAAFFARQKDIVSIQIEFADIE